MNHTYMLHRLTTWIFALAMAGIIILGAMLPSTAYAAAATASTPVEKAPCEVDFLWGGPKNPPTGYTDGILGWTRDASKTPEAKYSNSLYVYLIGISHKIMPWIFVTAIIYVIFSGIQYMLSGYSPGLEKQAKQRITGVVVGVIFYFMMVTVYNFFVCGIPKV